MWKPYLITLIDEGNGFDESKKETKVRNLSDSGLSSSGSSTIAFSSTSCILKILNKSENNTVIT